MTIACRYPLPREPPPRQTSCAGTFPTFMGEHTVKFFGRRFDGAECFRIEQFPASPGSSETARPRAAARGGRVPVLRTFLDAYGWPR
jgi:hypothetical protein